MFDNLTELLEEQTTSLAFVLNRYLLDTFQGIMPNSRVVGVSTVGES